VYIPFPSDENELGVSHDEYASDKRLLPSNPHADISPKGPDEVVGTAASLLGSSLREFVGFAIYPKISFPTITSFDSGLYKVGTFFKKAGI
jgi:hypothetical protein